LLDSSPDRRPADILTSAALVDGLAAIDVGISSPEATGAGTDCCEAMRARKMRELGPHLAELRGRGVEYRPMTFSCFGRWHPESSALAEHMARTAARRRGLADPRLILRRARRRVGVAIAQRAVRLLRACLPGADDLVEL